MGKDKANWMKLIIAVLAMIVLTAALLLGGAAIVYYMELSAKIAHMFIVGTYILVGLFGGFFIGRMVKERRFIWGIGVGICYYACLVLVSLIVHGGAIEDVVQMLVTFVLVTASAMIGGMVS